MFKLIKLGFYVLVGYMLYELYQGFNVQAGTGGSSSGSWGGSQSRGGQLSGAGEGMTEETFDDTGASSPHRVGRGVVM